MLYFSVGKEALYSHMSLLEELKTTSVYQRKGFLRGERLLWESRPSQWVNVPIFVICALSSFLILPVFFAIWKYLEVYTTTYEATDQRIFIKYGVLNRKQQEVELYRIKDYVIVEPLLYRFFGLSDLLLRTSDKTAPEISMRAIRDAKAVRDQIRVNVELLREIKKVREIDL